MKDQSVTLNTQMKKNFNVRKIRIKCNRVNDVNEDDGIVDDSLRESVISQFTRLLGNRKLAEKLEDITYSEFGESKFEYCTQVYDISVNIAKDTHVGNKEGKKRVIEMINKDGRIVSIRDLFTERWKKYIDRLAAKQDATKNYKIVGSKAYVCPECGARNALCEAAQFRSGDEGQSFWVICGECGKSWML